MGRQLLRKAGWGARETIVRLSEIDPEVTAVVSTGYSKGPITEHYRKFGFAGCVTKPYNMHRLSWILHEALY